MNLLRPVINTNLITTLTHLKNTSTLLTQALIAGVLDNTNAIFYTFVLATGIMGFVGAASATSKYLASDVLDRQRKSTLEVEFTSRTESLDLNKVLKRKPLPKLHKILK